ncbi:MAG: transposase [Chloroflexota bacterium]
MMLEAIPAEKLLATLEREHWTGRKGYSVRGMWSGLVAGLWHKCRSIADVVRLLKRNREVRLVCGFSKDHMPGEDALRRFVKKLVKHEDLVEECFCGLVERLRQLLAGFGSKLAVDSTEIEAYANGHRKTPADPDARWGAKSKGGGSKESAGEGSESRGKGKKRDLHWWFGYKLHLAVDVVYELPASFVLTPANKSDTEQMAPLLKKAVGDKAGAKLEALIGDKGYDSQDNCRLVYEGYGALPIIPIRERADMQLPDICNAKGTPTCVAGLEMVYWGRDGKYLKYRCPAVVGKAKCPATSPCTASGYGYVLKLSIADDPRRHPPLPRETKKWARLYRLRTSVERVNSRLKEQLGLDRITLRGQAKVTLTAVLSLVVMLGAAVSMAERHRLKELRMLAA